MRLPPERRRLPQTLTDTSTVARGHQQCLYLASQSQKFSSQQLAGHCLEVIVA
jgi:hypothetical protein